MDLPLGQVPTKECEAHVTNSKNGQDGKSNRKSADSTADVSKTKKPVFKEIEDVISVGALLRPTFVKAVGDLAPVEREQIKSILIDVERALSNPMASYYERFSQAQDVFTRTYRFGPTWRFIAGRIEQSWREVEAPSVKELSLVSLLVGMLFEQVEKGEFQSTDSNDSKNRRQAG